MMRKILGAPAVLAACMLAGAPPQAQFGGLLRKVTTPAPKPSSDANGGCPKGKKGSSIGRNILGNVLNDAVGDAASVEVLGTPFCGKGEPGQVIRVGHASPPCLFRGVDVFGGG